jgi:hypothetical protein
MDVPKLVLTVLEDLKDREPEGLIDEYFMYIA